MTTTTNTSTTPLSTVIGVFPTHEQADRAIDELRHTNFRYDHIRVVERGAGGFADTLKGVFTGQAAMASNTADSLVKMGMPEYEAQYYQNELDADHVLILMNAEDRPEDAFGVMRQNGAFDIQSRLRMPPANVATTERATQQTQTTYQPQTPVTATPAVAPNADRTDTRYTGSGAQRNAEGAPVAYDPAAQPMAYNPAAQQAAPTPNASPDPDMIDQRTNREAPQNA
ncbi:MAG TPA: hypothetical protein VGM01_05085 [Ktedonobacteraceae bacterium]|jgi:hypothetical protein